VLSARGRSDSHHWSSRTSHYTGKSYSGRAAACSRSRCAGRWLQWNQTHAEFTLFCCGLRADPRQSCCCWRCILTTMMTTTGEKSSEKEVVTATKTTTYRTAAAAPRSLVITRTSSKPSSGGASSSTMTRTVTTRLDGSAFAEGAYSSLTATGVNQVKTTRDQEKRDMQDLNDRFADYINKVCNRYCNNKPIKIRKIRIPLKNYCIYFFS